MLILGINKVIGGTCGLSKFFSLKYSVFESFPETGTHKDTPKRSPVNMDNNTSLKYGVNRKSKTLCVKKYNKLTNSWQKENR